MTILALQRTADTISNYIKNCADKAGKTSLVVGMNDGINSALVALLCKDTNINTIGVFSPHQELQYERYPDPSLFMKDFGIVYKSINIQNPIKEISEQNLFPYCFPSSVAFSKFSADRLKQLLQISTIAFVASGISGLIVSGVNKNDEVIRGYEKFGGCGDISPIAQLYQSEVIELFTYLSGGKESAKKIVESVPAIQYDGLAYDEVEWASKQDIYTNIISDDGDPVKHKAWLGYTGRQRIVIAQIHQLEKASRDKINNTPMCNIRNIDGLIR